jgi:ferredoxin
MNDSKWLPQIDPARCVGSGDCVSACPTGALGLLRGKAVLVNPGACIYCADCESLCKSGAISLPYQIVLAGDE